MCRLQYLHSQDPAPLAPGTGQHHGCLASAPATSRQCMAPLLAASFYSRVHQFGLLILSESNYHDTSYRIFASQALKHTVTDEENFSHLVAAFHKYWCKKLSNSNSHPPTWADITERHTSTAGWLTQTGDWNKEKILHFTHELVCLNVLMYIVSVR